MSDGGKGVKYLTPLGRVDQEIGKRSGVSYETVRKSSSDLGNTFTIDSDMARTCI